MVLPRAVELARALQGQGIRAHVDTRTHLSPGFKFNDWELRGVPVRLELGSRDLAAGTALMSLRLSQGKTPVPLGAAPALHCGQPGCEDIIKSETSASPRCVPLDGPPASGRCVRCGLPSAYGKRVIFGRAY
jgi:prolyl-tRNA synthetase